MMKYLFTILVLSVFLVSTANARNCVVAVHNPHCSSSSGHSSSQSQTTTATGAVGQTPDPAKTNSHLGSGTQTQPIVVQIYPVVPHTIVGQALAPIKPKMNVPVIPAINKPPQIYTYKVPIATPLKPVMNVPSTSKQPMPPLQVFMVPGKVITGNSAVPQQPITTAPPKTFTAPPQQQVYPVPGKVITGQSAVPQQPITTAPPKTFTAPPQQQVYPVPGKVITGQSAVPQQPITTAPPKTYTSPPQQQVYPIPSPILVGQAAVPVKTVINTPSQQTPTPILIAHVASSNFHRDILLQQEILHSGASLKTLEPHIKNLKVDVYTDKNVTKMAYKNSSRTNTNGFHLAVVGIKEASIIERSPLPVAAKNEDIIFNFSFASAEIHKDQLSQIDEIITIHSKSGKQIFLTGETDGFGSEEYNKHLAMVRAHNIIDALKAREIKVDEVTVSILVRCCRKDHPTKKTLAETSEQRITWVHFQ